MINAKVILDSISPVGKRLTTLELRYPKFIHGELMTHRVLSRNASSSRAVPVSKLLAEVRSDELRAGPVYWGAEQRGMQAGEQLLDVDRMAARAAWAAAAHAAADHAEALAQLGVHKSVVNRVLEPFSHINVVVTATEWDNFFGLRLDKLAQPEMRLLAEHMWAARRASEPRHLLPGDWHLPYILAEEWQEWAEGDWPIERAIKVSVARVARVSYKSFETGKLSTVEEDVKLHDRLLASKHLSPFEHQATPDTNVGCGPTTGRWIGDHDLEWGNLVGWRQYRKSVPGEAVTPLPEAYR